MKIGMSDERKIKEDTRENTGSLAHNVEQQRKREKHLYPLRSDSRTIFLVKKKDCNQKHLKEYQNRLDNNDSLLRRNV